MLLEIVLIFGIFLSATQTSEICKSDSGKMTISEETNILAVFKGEYGHNTILVKEKNLDEEFNFTCHNYGNTKNTNIVFGIENSNSSEKYPASRVLKNSDLEGNNVGTNTKPYPVKCENICQVNFIVTYFDTSTLCNENNSENWNCGIKEMEEELNLNFRHSKWDLVEDKAMSQ